MLSERARVRRNLFRIQVPTYQEDITKLCNQLSHIWNAFLRGQLLIFAITVAYYSVLLSILGVRYFFLLAILAGLARFVPYIGPFVAWTTYGLVALFQ
jgi:predicted PurR-regulated permease PerM